RNGARTSPPCQNAQKTGEPPALQLCAFLVVLVVALAGCVRQPLANNLLITGKSIGRQAAPYQDVGSLPMNMIATPDGRFAIATDMGFRQSLCTIRLADGKRVGQLDFPNRTST